MHLKCSKASVECDENHSRQHEQHDMLQAHKENGPRLLRRGLLHAASQQAADLEGRH